jgi:hypothetical protein
VFLFQPWSALREPHHFYEATAPDKHFFETAVCEARIAKSCIILVESELQHDVVLVDRIDFKDFNKYY